MSSPPLNEPLPPPPPNITRGPSLVILSVVLHVFSLPIVGTRIWTRAWPRCRLWWDDYTILAAAAFDMINWILVLLAVEHGLGRPTIHVPAAAQPSEGRMFLFFAQHASGWAVCFAKLSIALMLFKLRRDDSVLWRTFLLVMMLFPVAMAVTTTATLFSACTPVSAMWDFDIKNFECKSPKKIGEAILATSIITVVTDFVLALLPVTFIVRFKRSVREKVLLAVVMGLGLVASTASLLKIHSVLSKELTGDTLVDGVDVTFWGILEMQLGIIAACVPCLKRLAERVLHRLGLLSSHTPTFYHLERDAAAAAAAAAAATAHAANRKATPNGGKSRGGRSLNDGRRSLSGNDVSTDIEDTESAWEMAPHDSTRSVAVTPTKPWEGIDTK